MLFRFLHISFKGFLLFFVFFENSWNRQPSLEPPSICVQKSRSRVRTRARHVWSGRWWCEGPVGGANLRGATLKKQSRRPVNQGPSQTEAVWGPSPSSPFSTATGRKAPADWPRSGEPDETRAPIGEPGARRGARACASASRPCPSSIVIVACARRADRMHEETVGLTKKDETTWKHRAEPSRAELN